MADLKQNTSYSNNSSTLMGKDLKRLHSLTSKTPQVKATQPMSSLSYSLMATPTPSFSEVKPSTVSGERFSVSPDKAIKRSVPSDYKSFYRPEVAPNTEFIQLSKITGANKGEGNVLLGGGEYAESKTPSEDLPISFRSYDPLDRKEKLQGLDSSLWEIDHVVPLWLKGSDRDENKQMIFWKDHEKKTKVQEVVRSLYNNKKIGEKEALALSLNWDLYDDKGIDTSMVVASGGEQTIPVETAQKIFESWKKGPDMSLTSWTGIKNNLKGFFSGEGNFSPESFKHVTDVINEKVDAIKNPALNKGLNVGQEVLKGIASASTLGYVDLPTATDENDTDADKFIKGGAKFAGNLAGSIASFFATGGLLAGGLKGASALATASKAPKIASGLSSASNLFARNEIFVKPTVTAIEGIKPVVSLTTKIFKPLTRDVIISNVLGQAYKQDPSMSRMERAMSDTASAIFMNVIPPSAKGMLSKDNLARILGVAGLAYTTNMTLSGDQKSSIEQALLFASLYTLGGKGYAKRVEKIGRNTAITNSLDNLKTYEEAFKKEVDPNFKLSAKKGEMTTAEKKSYEKQMKDFNEFVTEKVSVEKMDSGMSQENFEKTLAQRKADIEILKDNAIYKADNSFFGKKATDWKNAISKTEVESVLGNRPNAIDLPRNAGRFLKNNLDLVDDTKPIKKYSPEAELAASKIDTGIVDQAMATGANNPIHNANLVALSNRIANGTQKTDTVFIAHQPERGFTLNKVNATDKDILAGKKTPYNEDEALQIFVKNDETGDFEPIGYVAREEKIGKTIIDPNTGEWKVEGVNTQNGKLNELRQRYPGMVLRPLDSADNNFYIKSRMDDAGTKVVMGKMLRDKSGKLIVGVGKESKNPYMLYKIGRDDLKESVKRNYGVDYSNKWESPKMIQEEIYASKFSPAVKVLVKEPVLAVNADTMNSLVKTETDKKVLGPRVYKAGANTENGVRISKEVVSTFINDFKVAVQSKKVDNIITVGKKYNLNIPIESAKELLLPENRNNLSIEHIFPIVKGQKALLDSVPSANIPKTIDIKMHFDSLSNYDESFIPTLKKDVNKSLLNESANITEPGGRYPKTAPSDLSIKIGMYTRKPNPNIKSIDQKVMETPKPQSQPKNKVLPETPKEEDFIKSLETEAKTIEPIKEIPATKEGDIVGGKPISKEELEKMNDILGGKKEEIKPIEKSPDTVNTKEVEASSKDEITVNEDDFVDETKMTYKNATKFDFGTNATINNLIAKDKFTAIKNNDTDKLVKLTELSQNFSKENMVSNAKKNFDTAKENRGFDDFYNDIKTTLKKEGVSTEFLDNKLVEKEWKRWFLRSNKLEATQQANLTKGEKGIEVRYKPKEAEIESQMSINHREFVKKNGLDEKDAVISTFDNGIINNKRISSATEAATEVEKMIKDLNATDRNFIVIGPGKNSFNSIVTVDADIKKLAKIYDKTPENYKFDKASDPITNYDKAERVVLKDIVGLAENSYSDFSKRISILNNKELPLSLANIPKGQKIIFKTLTGDKVKDSGQDIKKNAPKHLTDEQISKGNENFVENGVVLISPKLSKILKDDLGLPQDVKRYKMTVNDKLDSKNNFFYKGNYIEADEMYKEFLKRKYGVEMRDYDIIGFQDSAKAGLTDVYKMKDGSGRDMWVHEIEPEKIRVKYEDVPKNDVSVAGNVIGKISVKDAIKYGFKDLPNKIAKLFETPMAKIKELHDDIYNKHLSLEEAFKKYDLKIEDILDPKKLELYKNGAGVVEFSKHIDQTVRKMIQEKGLSLKGQIVGRRAKLNAYSKDFVPELNEVMLEKDGLKRVIVGKEFLKKIKAKDGDEMLMVRQPNTTLQSAVKVKVIDGSKYKMDHLGEDNMIISADTEYNVLNADLDGDDATLFKLSKTEEPDALPYELAEYIEAVRKAEGNPMPKPLTKYPKTPLNPGEIMKKVKQRMLGVDATTEVLGTNRIKESLHDADFKAEIIPKGENKSTVKISIGGKEVRSKDINLSVKEPIVIEADVSTAKKFKDIDDAQMAVDSSSTSDLSETGYKPGENYIFNKLFKATSGNKDDVAKLFNENGLNNPEISKILSPETSKFQIPFKLRDPDKFGGAKNETIGEFLKQKDSYASSFAQDASAPIWSKILTKLNIDHKDMNGALKAAQDTKAVENVKNEFGTIKQNVPSVFLSKMAKAYHDFDSLWKKPEYKKELRSADPYLNETYQTEKAKIRSDFEDWAAKEIKNLNAEQRTGVAYFLLTDKIITPEIVAKITKDPAVAKTIENKNIAIFNKNYPDYRFKNIAAMADPKVLKSYYKGFEDVDWNKFYKKKTDAELETESLYGTEA